MLGIWKHSIASRALALEIGADIRDVLGQYRAMGLQTNTAQMGKALIRLAVEATGESPMESG